MKKLREETAEADAILKQKQLEEGPKAAFGYGGKFGVQADRLVLFCGLKVLEADTLPSTIWSSLD